MFRAAHPHEAPHYRTLEPAPPDFKLFLQRREQDELRKLVEGVEQQRQDGAGLEDYVRQMRAHYSDESFFTSVPRDIGESLSKGGNLYFFRYSKGGFGDEGLVVLRDGKVVYRFPKLE